MPTVPASPYATCGSTIRNAGSTSTGGRWSPPTKGRPISIFTLNFEPFYRREYGFLADYNAELLGRLCSLLRVPMPEFSQAYVAAAAGDTDLRPKRRNEGPAFIAEPYVQVFSDRMPFQPNLSVADLLFAEGPEAVSVLRRCRL